MSHKNPDADTLSDVAAVLDVIGWDAGSLSYERQRGKASSRGTLHRRFGNWEEVKQKANVFSNAPATLLDNKVGFPDMKVANLDAMEWLDFLEGLADKFQEAEFGQQLASINIETDRPIAIAYTSDWHLGSISTNYKEFKENLEFILETDDLYCIVVGDTIDNFISFPDKSAILTQILPADKQKLLFESILKELCAKRKILAVGWGDHDARFEERVIGSPVIEYLTRNRVPYFPGKGLIKLSIGDLMDDTKTQNYTNVITHRSRYSSYLNEVWASSQEYRMFFPGDVIVTAHHHSPAYAVVNRYPVAREAGFSFGGEVALIRTGTYKGADRYSMRFWNKGIIGVPTVVYSPSEYRFDVYKSAERAVELGLKGGKEK